MSIGPVESLILTAFFVAAPIVLAVALGRWLASVTRGAIRSELRKLDPGGRNAREILDERYARGEVGREEYETMRRDLAG